ncbi:MULTISPECIES: hypothetical protein [unclassified Massilia]|uniref:hypothetical protein n=1 Tax=unclassified Massilia TaxID=2609279 RepID=UPI001B8199AB|nr:MULTISPECIES: hypothetical protein [unclassified Massilia]MBQ5941645.1 hypothetical protein [Massilia sp. AB1]MBQ5962546.1 hypothetical protein [Massilia sp. ZL223]
MMTDTLSTPQQQTEGRTVREIVEHNQEMVNEPWCRRIIRQVLQSLELQYAMQMPYRPITPDTVLVLDSGDPMLLPAQSTVPGDTEAQDIHDLAAVVHFAITREAAPDAPLRGRAPGGYSDSFVGAIDRCLSPDPQERPQTIEQLRNLLGIVVLGPPMANPVPPAAATAPSAAPPVAQFSAEAEPDFLRARQPARVQRWLLLGLAATVLLGGLAALLALLHASDSRDALTLTLPEPGAQQQAAAPPAPAFAAQGGMDQAPALTPAPAALGSGVAVTPEAPAAALPAPRPGVAPPTAVTVLPAAAKPGATYKLQIKPWGTILVNGVNRGVSPPLKRLTLPAGQHTIRIINPSFPEHTVTVNSVKGANAIIELDFTEGDSE